MTLRREARAFRIQFPVQVSSFSQVLDLKIEVSAIPTKVLMVPHPEPLSDGVCTPASQRSTFSRCQCQFFSIISLFHFPDVSGPQSHFDTAKLIQLNLPSKSFFKQEYSLTISCTTILIEFYHFTDTFGAICQIK